MLESNYLIIFNHLFEKHYKQFVYYAFTYVHDRQIAEDIVSESFMSYWNNKEDIEDSLKIRSYILASIRNKSLNYLRQQKRVQYHLDSTQDIEIWDLEMRISLQEANNPANLISNELQNLVDKSLNELPSQTKTIFEKSRYDNYTYKEIAEEMGVSTKSIEFHISKALRLLRDKLKDFI